MKSTGRGQRDDLTHGKSGHGKSGFSSRMGSVREHWQGGQMPAGLWQVSSNILRHGFVPVLSVA